MKTIRPTVNVLVFHQRGVFTAEPLVYVHCHDEKHCFTARDLPLISLPPCLVQHSAVALADGCAPPLGLGSHFKWQIV